MGTLKYVNPFNNGSQLSEDEYNKGRTWQTFGRDNGNVIILSNHYKDGGTNVYLDYRLTLDHNFLYRTSYSLMTLLSEKKLNISPTTGKKLEDNASAEDSVKDVDAIYLAGTLAHEFMHSIFIADEYEGGTGDPDPNDIDTAPNLATINHLAKPGAGNITNKIINPTKIKWNLKRVALSSMVEVDTVSLSGNILTVKLEEGQSTKWQKVLDNNLPLYIRSSRFQPNQDVIFKEWAINKITEIDSSTDTIKLELKAGSNSGDPDLILLNRGCHIYLPKRLNDDYSNDIANHELCIINPRVFEFMEITEKPLRTKDCNYSNTPAYPPSDSEINEAKPGSDYPEFCSPNNRFIVSGAYEGGGLHNCKVYRPSGSSLMRLPGLKEGYVYRDATLIRDVDIPPSYNDYSIYSRFDFFSKYFLVARFYPTKLEDLDRSEYGYYDSTIF